MRIKHRLSSPACMGRVGLAMLLGLAIGHGASTHAGWTGQMNGTGFGKASVNVTSVTSSSRTVTTPNMLSPSAAMTTTAGYFAGGPLPSGASASTVARIKGSAGYIWSATTYASGGDKTDNPEIESRINITPAECAALTMESSAVIGPDGRSGMITVNASATQGTALLLRGFEYFGVGQPENIEDLRANGALKWEMLMVGPFDLSAANCNALVIPFSIDTAIENLYFVSDAAAHSKPFTITCPISDSTHNIEFSCLTPQQEIVYPAPHVEGGCGEVTVTFDPPAHLLPAGTSVVTATATDQAGAQVQCSFIATRRLLGFSGFFAPLNGVGGTCSAPLRTIKKGSSLPVKFTTTCEGFLTFGGRPPTFEVRKCSDLELVTSGTFRQVVKEWHFNWVTESIPPGIYQLTATLQDGTKREVIVRLK